MTERASEPSPRIFSIEQANRMLPLVQAIVGDIVPLAQDVIERRQRLEQLRQRRDAKAPAPYVEELRQSEASLRRDEQRLAEFVRELRQLGVEMKGLVEGLVDFPAWMDGRIVHLCWKLGEPEIGHWREAEEGFRRRRPLPAAGELEAARDLDSAGADGGTAT